MGSLIAATLLAQERFHVVAAADLDPAKAGTDLGSLVGVKTNRVRVAQSIDLVKSARPGGVAVLSTSSKLRNLAPQVRQLLRLGWNVVSTCEELSQPWSELRLATTIDRLAKRSRLSVVGTGVNPGYVFDTWPLLLTAACVKVRSVRVKRTVDTNQRRVPLQLKAGVGLSKTQFRAKVASGHVGHVGLAQSGQLLASALGWNIDSWQEKIEPVLATVDTQAADQIVSAGSVIGLHQRAVGIGRGHQLIAYELNMSSGATTHDEVEILGDPPLRSTIADGLNGDVATAAIVANMIPVVQAARPGLLTMRDVMPLCGVGA